MAVIIPASGNLHTAPAVPSAVACSCTGSRARRTTHIRRPDTKTSADSAALNTPTPGRHRMSAQGVPRSTDKALPSPQSWLSLCLLAPAHGPGPGPLCSHSDGSLASVCSRPSCSLPGTHSAHHGEVVLMPAACPTPVHQEGDRALSALLQSLRPVLLARSREGESKASCEG